MTTPTHQPSIINNIPTHGYYLIFSCQQQDDAQQTLLQLAPMLDYQKCTLGLGSNLLKQETNIFEKHTALQNEDKILPSKNHDLAIWLQGHDAGVLFHQARKLIKTLSTAFKLEEITRANDHLPQKANDNKVNHDLSGFEDGTENPEGKDISKTAFVQSEDRLQHSGSCWVLQKWQHQFDQLDNMTQNHKEKLVGRSLDDNHEFDDNQPSAHVQRTAQESFSPQAFMWRRSMPWINDQLKGGLMFSAFAQSFYPFEAQMNRMLGNEDNIIDGIFEFSSIQYTSYFWCPPLVNKKLAYDLALRG